MDWEGYYDAPYDGMSPTETSISIAFSVWRIAGALEAIAGSIEENLGNRGVTGAVAELTTATRENWVGPA